MATPIDAEVTELARTINSLAGHERWSAGGGRFWSQRMLAWAMANPDFKTQLFRFVDVFPATHDASDVLRHVHEYFQGDDAPRLLALGVDLAEKVPFGGSVTASVARRNILRMAEQFIVGSTAAEAVDQLHALWRRGSAFTVDLLGEKTVTEDEADRYAARVDELVRLLAAEAPGWAPDDTLDFDDKGRLPRVNVSIKPTALASLYAPLTRDDGLRQAKSRLRPLLDVARDRGACVNFDMEHYDVKDLTVQLFRELLDESAFADLHAGIVVQAYLKDSLDDLADIVSWARGRRTPIAVRLVKGAYWDSETIQARAEGWPVPVFERKDETDANYERLTRLLLDHSADVRPAFASHNLRSLAYAIGYARSRGIHDSAFEIQMLHGMAEPIHAAIRRLGLRLRVYTPVGDLVPGMAYLVRRLLENTSNESFVRHRFEEHHSLDELVRPPEVDVLPAAEDPRAGADTDPAAPGPYHHEPHAELRRAPARERLATAVRALGDALAGPIEVPAVIGGERVRTGTSIDSVDPGDLGRLVARSASCSTADADAAVGAAAGAFPAWSATPAPERAAVLFRAAAWMRARRDELAALVLFEAGKPWREADADVCEAIDFCEYYGREMVRLDEGGRVLSSPGEHNRLRYQGRGVVAVIAPWNFPLAIPTGMVAAALVTGNCVVFKPAEQTPAVAFRLVEAMEAAGLPAGVLNFVPGAGEVVGAHLVAHPEIAQVAFTGSRAVGLGIVERAGRWVDGQRQVKRVIAEMGGKNALVVDADADLDQAVPATISSAFGYAGQKCSAVSRVVVLDDVYEDFLQRLLGAAAQQRTGHPSDMGIQVGPLIDADAHERVERYVDLAASEATIAHRGAVPASPRGWYAAPTIVTGLATSSRVARDEIFGPVLAVFRAGDFEAALELANDTDYALTAGLMSRSPAHIAEAAARLRAGNVYVNRGTTGAIVGRQPFGGYGLSGVGSKAGGPDYLLQFLDQKVVTENTLRQGFAPDTDSTDR